MMPRTRPPYPPGVRQQVNELSHREHTLRGSITSHLVKIALLGLIGLFGAPALVSGDTADGAPFADTWETLLRDARAQARPCGDDTYAESSPLIWNTSLGEAAQAHSEDMAQMGRMRHEGSEGGTLADRLGNAGYEARAWAENVAAGQQNAAAVVAAWLESPGHCANIMSADYTEFGAGVVRDASGKRYWTLVLAAPRD